MSRQLKMPPPPEKRKEKKATVLGEKLTTTWFSCECPTGPYVSKFLSNWIVLQAAPLCVARIILIRRPRWLGRGGPRAYHCKLKFAGSSLTECILAGTFP